MQLRSLNVAPMRVAGARALELHQLLPSCLCWTPVHYDALRPYCTGYVKRLAGHAHELQVACWFGCCLLVPAISRYLEDCFPLYPPDGFGMFGGTCFNEIKPVVSACQGCTHCCSPSSYWHKLLMEGFVDDATWYSWPWQTMKVRSASQFSKRWCYYCMVSAAMYSWNCYNQCLCRVKTSSQSVVELGLGFTGATL